MLFIIKGVLLSVGLCGATVVILNGWLINAKRVLSPNFNCRPPHAPINAIVVHNISLPPAQFGGGYIEAFFQNSLDSSAHSYFREIRNLQVSSHCLIDRFGTCTQFVSFGERAWHAGVSCLNGEENCNDFSIGIELEGTDNLPYTDAQYDALVLLCCDVMRAYPKITLDRIVGHSHIAPERKTDPGVSFDWVRFRTALQRSEHGVTS